MANKSILNNLSVETTLLPFQDALGNSFDKVVNDVKSVLGRIKDNEIETKNSGWKATAGFKLKSRDGYTIQLASNNPAVILLCFAMRLNELCDSGEFQIEATIPKNCESWIAQHKIAAKSETIPATV